MNTGKVIFLDFTSRETKKQRRKYQKNAMSNSSRLMLIFWHNNSLFVHYERSLAHHLIDCQGSFLGQVIVV